MKVAEFDFELPPERIAQRPIEPRDAARLLHVRPDGLDDRTVHDLPALLRPGDLLVLNDTKVIPARLFGRRGAAQVEVTLHRPEDAATWRAFARPARRCRPGDRLEFAADFAAEVVGKGEGGEITLTFELAGGALLDALHRHGHMPLPPYIKRAAGADAADLRDYQNPFGVHEGAVAAPTASLHFTSRVLAALDEQGVQRTTLTLHVGAGTFLPVKVDDTDDHRMHAERFVVPDEAAVAICAARGRGARIVAVGTTVLRTLETVAARHGAVVPAEGATDLFVTPGYRFRVVDLLVTNFHLPRSTLFMLVGAFAGLERMQAAYAHAIAAGYRFFSYGDACLLERAA